MPAGRTASQSTGSQRRARMSASPVAHRPRQVLPQLARASARPHGVQRDVDPVRLELAAAAASLPMSSK
jgi:hypothetical protein